MPLEGHLDELRRRLTWSAAVILPLFVVLFLVRDPILRLVLDSAKPSITKFHFLSPQELFLSFLKIDFFLSLVAASPFWLYQALAFFLPAFSRQARGMVLRLLPAMIGLFLAGVAFGLKILLPIVLNFLVTFAPGIASPEITISNYTSFLLGVTMPPGFLFEMPLIAYGLATAGIITSSMLIKGWRFAILGAAVLSAVFAPPGPLPMLALGAPILALYQASIFVAAITGRRRQRRLAQAAADEYDGDTGG